MQSAAKNHVASSFVYKFVERLAVKGIGLVISILLARMLAPEIFGLLAIINVFVNLAQTFVQSGLGTALIQNKNTTLDDYSTVFYLSFCVAAAMVLLLNLTAPLIAGYYSNDLLIGPLRVFSLSLLFGAYNSVQTAKMQREMKFRSLMVCNLIATIISGSMGVLSAYMGAGIWALIIYNFANIVVVCVCMQFTGKWHPTLTFSPERARVLFSFGWKMLVSALLTALYNDMRTLIVGKKYSSTDLAYYNRGQQFPEVLALSLDVSIQSVMLPVMSKQQDNTQALRSLLNRAISLSTFVVAPVMLGMFATANTLIPFLLTDKWIPSIPLLQIFCITYLNLPMRTSDLSLIKAMGRSDMYMRLEFVRRIVMIVILLATVFLFNSVTVIALGFCLSTWLDAVIITFATRKLIGVTFLDHIRTIGSTLLSGVVMSAVVYAMNALPLPLVLRLFLQVLVGAAVYVLLSAVMKNSSFTYLLSEVRKHLRPAGKK